MADLLRISATLLIDREELTKAVQEAGGLPPSVAPWNDGTVELPPEWVETKRESGIKYTWGEHTDRFDPLVTYAGTLSTGVVEMAIGKCERTRVHGEDRTYYIVMLIGPQGGRRAISEFLATDDYDSTGDVIAVIKGKDGGGRLFDPGDDLPAVYSPWEIVRYRDRVDYPGSYTKAGLVCSELDFEAMLNHALAQVQLRKLDE